jgi:hypothetical protein
MNGKNMNEASFKNKWYYYLTKSYMENSFPDMNSFSSFEQRAIHIVDSLEYSKKIGDRDNALMEYYTYFLLLSYKNDLIKETNREDYISLINKANNIANNPSIDAYTYIEKHILNVISNAISNPKINSKSTPVMRALVIGISDYENLDTFNCESRELTDLKYAKKDANDFAKLLEEYADLFKEKPIVFTDRTATTKNVKDKLVDIFTSNSEDEVIFLFFSGHGRACSKLPNKAYFLTYDFDPENDYSGVEFSFITDLINESRAKHIFMFMDACKSGMISRGGKGEAMNTMMLSREWENFMPNRIILTSSSENERSFESDELKNGIFTYFLLEGLRGENENIKELAQYIKEEVRDFCVKGGHKSTCQESMLFMPKLHDYKMSPGEESVPIIIRRK